jgi:hypothetical protein
LKGLYDGLQLQLMSSTYPNFQTMWITPLWWTTSSRRWMLRGKGFRDRPLAATLISALVSSKVISRGTHLVSGIMDSSQHAIRSCNVPRTSPRMWTNALSSRMGINLSVRAYPTTLPWRLVFLIPPIGVSDVVKGVICLTIALRSLTSRPPEAEQSSKACA